METKVGDEEDEPRVEEDQVGQMNLEKGKRAKLKPKWFKDFE